MYKSGVWIKSKSLGASKLLSIIFSKPLPIEQIKKVCGTIPKNVANKKLCGFTLNIHGNTLDIANGMPPINLYTNKQSNSDFLNLTSKF